VAIIQDILHEEDEDMSLKLAKKIMSILDNNNIPFIKIKVNENTINSILGLIL